MQTLSAFYPSCESLGFPGAAFLRHSVKPGTASSGSGFFICDLLVNSGNIVVGLGGKSYVSVPGRAGSVGDYL